MMVRNLAIASVYGSVKFRKNAEGRLIVGTIPPTCQGTNYSEVKSGLQDNDVLSAEGADDTTQGSEANDRIFCSDSEKGVE